MTTPPAERSDSEVLPTPAVHLFASPQMWEGKPENDRVGTTAYTESC